ncbi:glycosyltransferase [Streptosporangium sp. DT93]|uniref:glycosyltransferase family 2 protein n=1 Tax=Streptosporangium sp. DT93 TaxID=3393428 RepID=UPI003CEE6018
MTARIAGNDYRSLTLPGPGDWTPSLRVSVVVPAHGDQEKLDLALAGLAVQSYPADLTEVVVVDNGSEPPLRLPDLRPPGTRLIVCPVPGRAHARNAGLSAATGDVIHWLDSDVVLDRGSVEAHMRWHHAAPYLVVTGYLRFTPAALPTPETVAATADLATIFEPAEPHAWLVDLVERTDGLTANPHRAFSLHVGGATSVNAALLASTGPMDTDLILGQDTEMGYRLAQAGAVFVPEPRSRAFHLGPTMRMRDKAPIDRVSHAFVADRIPSYRWLRSHPSRQWKVPYVEVVVEPATRPGPATASGTEPGVRARSEPGDHVRGAEPGGHAHETGPGGHGQDMRPGGHGYGYDEVRATVDAVLAGTVPDVTVTLTGPWGRVGAEGRAPLRDPDLDLVLIRGHYAHEPRVRFVDDSTGPGSSGSTDDSTGSCSSGATRDSSGFAHDPSGVGSGPGPDFAASDPSPASGSDFAVPDSGLVPGSAAGPVPFRLRLPAGWVPGEDTLARLLDLAQDEGYGLVSVLLAEGDGEDGSPAGTGGATDLGTVREAPPAIVTARLERVAAFARAAIVREEGEDLDDAVEDTFGVIWVDGESHGFAYGPRPVAGRRGAYRARTEAEAEVARLTREAERLRGQVTKWRDEAGRWRRNTVELRREVGTLRKDLAAARKVVQYGLLSTVRRAITRRR